MGSYEGRSSGMTSLLPVELGAKTALWVDTGEVPWWEAAEVDRRRSRTETTICLKPGTLLLDFVV